MAAIGSLDATGLAASLLDPIPANRLFGLEVVSAADGVGEVALDVPASAANVIGSLHSSGLTALVDAAGLAAIISSAGAHEFEGVVPLGSAARMKFLAPGRGRLTARSRLEPGDRRALRALLDGRTDRATAETDAEVRDSAGDVVCRGTFQWSIRRVATLS